MSEMQPEDLYAVPLGEFTAARDRMVKELKAAGDDDAARRVKAIRKPSLPAWAVNRLARDEKSDLARWFELRDELAAASDAAELRSLTAERRRLLSRLLRSADDILRAADHATSATTTNAISKTLQAGGTDEERQAIQSGTLSRPLTPTGFEGLGGFEPSADDEDGEPRPPRPSAAQRKTAERLATEAEAAEREAHELARAAEKAAREAEDLVRRADKAAARAERARKKADGALDALGS